MESCCTSRLLQSESGYGCVQVPPPRSTGAATTPPYDPSGANRHTVHGSSMVHIRDGAAEKSMSPGAPEGSAHAYSSEVTDAIVKWPRYDQCCLHADAGCMAREPREQRKVRQTTVQKTVLLAVAGSDTHCPLKEGHKTVGSRKVIQARQHDGLEQDDGVHDGAAAVAAVAAVDGVAARNVGPGGDGRNTRDRWTLAGNRAELTRHSFRMLAFGPYNRPRRSEDVHMHCEQDEVCRARPQSPHPHLRLDTAPWHNELGHLSAENPVPSDDPLQMSVPETGCCCLPRCCRTSPPQLH